MLTHSPLVSVIIPTKNSAHTLWDCLESIKNQSYPSIEVIVVDNFSADGTWDIVQKYTDLFFQIWPERTTQKNHGIKKSHWEFIAFIDSDMILGKWVIAECAELLKSREKAWGVCIPEESIGEGFFVKVRNFERSFYGGESVESARFFRKRDVEKVGGFEEDIVFFEESLLPQKIEKTLWLDCSLHSNSIISHQEGYIDIVSWLKKKYYYGKSLWIYKNKVALIGVKDRGNSQMWIIDRYMIFFRKKRFYTHPILALWVLILKTLEFASGWLWYVSFLFTK